MLFPLLSLASLNPFLLWKVERLLRTNPQGLTLFISRSLLHNSTNLIQGKARLSGGDLQHYSIPPSVLQLVIKYTGKQTVLLYPTGEHSHTHEKKGRLPQRRPDIHLEVGPDGSGGVWLINMSTQTRQRSYPAAPWWGQTLIRPSIEPCRRDKHLHISQDKFLWSSYTDGERAELSTGGCYYRLGSIHLTWLSPSVLHHTWDVSSSFDLVLFSAGSRILMNKLKF